MSKIVLCKTRNESTKKILRFHLHLIHFNLKKSQSEKHKWLSFNSHSAHVSLTSWAVWAIYVVLLRRLRGWMELLLSRRRWGWGEMHFIQSSFPPTKYKHHGYCFIHRTFNVISFGLDKHVWSAFPFGRRKNYRSRKALNSFPRSRAIFDAGWNLIRDCELIVLCWIR